MLATAKLAAAGLLLAAPGVRAGDSCVWKNDAPSGASYDLRGLLDKTFVVTGGDIDCTSVVEQEYSYAFNPCGVVDAAALGSGATSACAAATSGGIPATVLQYDAKAGSCHGAGRSGTGSFSLAEASDRSKGVTLSFTTSKETGHKDTDYCNTNSKYRKTDIKILCDETATGTPNAAEFKVSEPKGPKGCEYEIIMHSAAGCPTQCGRSSDGKVCGGHGLCLTDTGMSSDATDDAARCFCNNGWGGDDCSSGGDADHNAVGSDMGGAIALLVILFLLMLGLGGVLWNLMKQVKGYRDDTANYLAIQEDGEVGKF